MYARIGLAPGLLLLAMAARGLHAAENGPKAPALDALLQATYGKAARWNRDWTARARLGGASVNGVGMGICADSGPLNDGLRWVVVCLSSPDQGHGASGSSDVFLLRGEGRTARTVASARDIGSNMGWGQSGDVSFVDVGPGRKAVLIEGGFTNMGVDAQGTSLTLSVGGRLQTLRWPSGYSDGARCDSEDKQCQHTATETTCNLIMDTRAGRDGFYPLMIRVRGHNKGRAVSRDVPIQYSNGQFTAPGDKALAALGCAYSG